MGLDININSLQPLVAASHKFKQDAAIHYSGIIYKKSKIDHVAHPKMIVDHEWSFVGLQY
jgi:hypothetical protein